MSLSGRFYPIAMIRLTMAPMTTALRTRRMKTRTVRPCHPILFYVLIIFVAEEWYQNDYPEEESDPSDLSDGPEDSDEDAFYDGRDDEIADDVDYDGPEWGDD